MKLTTLSAAVAATLVLGHSASAREYHGHHHYHHFMHRQARSHHLLYGREARRHYSQHRQALARHSWETAEQASWYAPDEASPVRSRRRRALERRSGYGARRGFGGRYALRRAHWTARADEQRTDYHGGFGARPSAWCGWEMRHLVSSDPGPSYNLARNWAHWGRSGPAGVGAIVVWPHHVGKIVGQENGQWIIESGNDGHRLRTRARSIGGAIAIRWG